MNIGPVVIELGMTAVAEPPLPKFITKPLPPPAPEQESLADIAERLDRLLDYAWSMESILEEIRDLSVPWYARLWRWLKGKF